MSVLVLHEILLVPVLTYGIETMLWKEKARSRIWAVRMDKLRGLLDIRSMDSPKCTDKRVVLSDERIDEGVLQWFGHVKRVKKDRIAKRVYVGKCSVCVLVGRPRKRWIDTVKDCLRKRGLDVG